MENIKTLVIDIKTSDLREKYQKELDSTVAEMESVRQQISKLDSYGVDLAAKANVLAGKIEALAEVEEMQREKNKKLYGMDSED